MAATRFVMAVRREMRSQVPADWQGQVASCPGAMLVGRDGGRVVVDLDPSALAQLRAQLGGWLHIEPALIHHPRPPQAPEPE